MFLPVVCLLVAAFAAAGEVQIPPAPVSPPPAYPPEEEVPTTPFGTELTVSYGLTTVRGDWPDPGFGGVAGFRFELFPALPPGPRVGAVLWGQSSFGPLQTATEVTTEASYTFVFKTTAYGVGVAMNADPVRKWGGTFAFGFGRLDIEGYQEGFLAVPVFTLHAGLRRRVDRFFVEPRLESGWGSARGETGEFEDWWTVGAALGVGVQVR